MRIVLTKSQLTTQRGAELFALLSEVTKDGMLSNDEIHRLRAWLDSSGVQRLPAEESLAVTLSRILANGAISRDERRELQKEIERILPPSQRAEAREARERIESILDVELVPVKDESNVAEERKLTKNEKAQAALLAAVKAHEAKVQAGPTRNITIPARQPYEPSATMKQKDFIWQLGLRDQAIIDSLGKWQASALIDQLKAESSGAGGCLLLLFVVLAVAIFLVLVARCSA